jgi:drug/metabolite transporter (DMT)-like permease
LNRLAIESRRGAYVALVVLSLVWGMNWIVMKFALRHADPTLYNIHRSIVAIVALFAVLLWQRRKLWPASWLAVLVTGIFQTTLNFGATTMALAEGGAGRTSVLVFTMPFWTILIAWPVLGERLRGSQWIAVALAFAGLMLVVEPWRWQGALAPKLWAVLSGFGWAAGTIAIKYFQRDHRFDMLNFMAWQMVLGLVPLLPLPRVFGVGPTDWGVEYVVLTIYTGAVSTAAGFVLWIAILRWLPAGAAALNMLAIPVIALVWSMLVFDERLTAAEWTGIACLGGGLAMIAVRAQRRGRDGAREAATPPASDAG